MNTVDCASIIIIRNLTANTGIKNYLADFFKVISRNTAEVVLPAEGPQTLNLRDVSGVTRC